MNDVTDVPDLLGAAECVLFDFDGPVCGLFHGHPAAGVARRLRSLLRRKAGEELLTPELCSTDDPFLVLQAVAAARPGGEPARLVERALTREEKAAAASAVPTPHAHSLVRALSATGRRLAVTTNNSPAAVELYLRRHRLAGPFGGHVHGRTADALALKPDPDCLLRALRTTGTPPDGALMIGDTPTDLLAARAAGVPFLGYARDAGKAALLRSYGAGAVVTSLATVLEAVGAPSYR